MVSKSAKRVSERFSQEKSAFDSGELGEVVEELMSTHRRIQMWVRSFPQVLRKAQQDAPRKNWVWQDPFTDFFETYDLFQARLWELGRKLDAIGTPGAAKAKATIEPPRPARVDQAISEIDFAPHPKTRQDHIIYPEARLKAWYPKFSDWLNKSAKTLKSIS